MSLLFPSSAPLPDIVDADSESKETIPTYAYFSTPLSFFFNRPRFDLIFKLDIDQSGDIGADLFRIISFF